MCHPPKNLNILQIIQLSQEVILPAEAEPNNLTHWRLKIHNTRIPPQGVTSIFALTLDHGSPASDICEMSAPLLSNVVTLAQSTAFSEPLRRLRLFV